MESRYYICYNILQQIIGNPHEFGNSWIGVHCSENSLKTPYKILILPTDETVLLKGVTFYVIRYNGKISLSLKPDTFRTKP